MSHIYAPEFNDIGSGQHIHWEYILNVQCKMRVRYEPDTAVVVECIECAVPKLASTEILLQLRPHPLPVAYLSVTPPSPRKGQGPELDEPHHQPIRAAHDREQGSHPLHDEKIGSVLHLYTECFGQAADGIRLQYDDSCCDSGRKEQGYVG